MGDPSLPASVPQGSVPGACQRNSFCSEREQTGRAPLQVWGPRAAFSTPPLSLGRAVDPSAQGLNAGVSVRDDDHDFECSGGDAKGCGRPVRVAPLPLASMGALSGRLLFMMSPSLPRDGGDWRNPPHVVELAD